MIPARPPGRRTRCISATALGRGAPDPPEAGDDVERRRIPRQGVHIADPDVAFRVPVPGHRDQPGRGVDTGAGSAAQAGQLDREPGPARHVEQPVSGIDAEPMVHRDVLPAVARLAEGREVHRLTAPALVHHRPLGKARARPRHRCSFASPGRRCAVVTGSSGRPVVRCRPSAAVQTGASRLRVACRSPRSPVVICMLAPSVVAGVTGQPAVWRCARRRGPRRRAGPSGNPAGCRLPPVLPASWWPGRLLWSSCSPSAGRPGSGRAGG